MAVYSMNSYQSVWAQLKHKRIQLAAWIILSRRLLAADALLLMFGIFDRMYPLSPIARLAIIICWSGLLVLLIRISYRSALSRTISSDRIAREIEVAYPHLQNTLINAVQFQKTAQTPEAAHAGLMNIEISRAETALSTPKLYYCLHHPAIKHDLQFSLLPVIALILILCIFPGMFVFDFPRSFFSPHQNTVSASSISTVRPEKIDRFQKQPAGESKLPDLKKIPSHDSSVKRAAHGSSKTKASYNGLNRLRSTGADSRKTPSEQKKEYHRMNRDLKSSAGQNAPLTGRAGLEDGYPRAYQPLVHDYFKSLTTGR